MSSDGDIRLRVFSGPHLGAEIVLPPGDHLLGGDDSCDIILTDHGLAARHAVVRVAAPEAGAGPDVLVTPLDSQAIIDGQPAAAQGSAWLPGTACLLGTTLLAWLPANQAPEAWRDVFEAMSKPREQSPEAPTQRPAVPETAASALLDETDPNFVGDNSLAATPTSRALMRANGTIKKLLRAAIMLLCLGALTVSYEFRPAPTAITATQLQEILAQNSFPALTATDGDAMLTIRGSVDSDSERARLLRLAQSLHAPIQLDIRVEADRAGGLAFAFNSRGLFPEIRKDPEGGHGYTVRGYMADRQVEDTAFAAVLADFQGQIPLALTRDIVHADAVAKELDGLLAEVEMDFVRVDYHPGLVTLSGTFTASQRHVLETTMAEVQQRLDKPVPFRILAATQPDIAPPRIAPIARGISAPAPSGDDPGPGTSVPGSDVPAGPGEDAAVAAIQVTGVTLTPMRFVSLATGERVFEGGLLPSGHTLEHIGHKELKLLKNGIVTIHKLRGADE